MNTKIFIFIILAALFLSACASPERSAVSPVEAGFSEEAFFEGAPAPEPSVIEAESDFNTMVATNAERIVIMNAEMELVVVAPDESMENISRLAEEMGGFVVNANLYKTRTADGQEVPRASITIRVPAERLEEALALAADACKRAGKHSEAATRYFRAGRSAAQQGNHPDATSWLNSAVQSAGQAGDDALQQEIATYLETIQAP